MQKWRLILSLCNLHMFLDRMELRVKNKKLSLDKTVLLMWSQIKKKMPYWPQMWVVLINIFSVSEVLLT